MKIIKSIFESYEKWKLFKMIFTLIIISAFVLIISFRFTTALFLIYSLFALFLFCALTTIENMIFPQWKKLRWSPTGRFLFWIILTITVFFVIPESTYKYIYIAISALIYVPNLVRAVQDLYYAKKYHLDNFSSFSIFNYENFGLEVEYDMDKSSEEYKNIMYEPIKRLLKTYPELDKKISIVTEEFLEKHSEE